MVDYFKHSFLVLKNNNSMQVKVLRVFPKAVMQMPMDRAITQEEVDFIMSFRNQTSENMGNNSSKDVDVLTLAPLASLRKVVQRSLDMYFLHVYIVTCLHDYMFACAHMHDYTCMQKYMYICIRTDTYKQIHLYIYIYIYKCILIYVYAYMSLHIHMFIRKLFLHRHISLKT